MDGTTSIAPASAPAQASSPAAPAPAGAPGQPRTADGRYSNTPPPAPQGSAQPPAAPWKRAFSVKSKSGGDETVEVDEAAVTRALAFEREGHHRLRMLNDDRAKFTAEQRAFQEKQREFDDSLGDPLKMHAFITKHAKDPKDAIRLRALMVRRDMEERDMDPVDRELRELRAMKTQREMEAAEQQQRAEKEAAEAELEAAAEKVRPQLLALFTSVLDAGGLPKTTASLEEVASAWKQSKEDGLDLDPAELASYVKDKMDGQIDARLADPSMTDEVLLERYPALAKRMESAIRNRILAKRGQGQRPANLNREGPSTVATAKDERTMPRVRTAAEDRALARGQTFAPPGR